MGAGQILLILQLVDAVAVLLRSVPDAKRQYDALSKQIRSLVAEGRDPTQTEWAELNARLAALSSRLESAGIKASGGRTIDLA